MKAAAVIALSFLLCAKSSAQNPASVQSLIDAAPAGSVLRIPQGTYDGDIVIRKKLSLLGVNMPVIQGSGKGSCVTVEADSCRIEGFRITRSGDNLREEHSGILLKSGNNRIEGNTLDDILFGIYLLRADSNVIAGNTIRGRAGIDLGQRGSGVHIYNSAGTVIERNTITEMRDGFYIQNANRTFLSSNVVTRLRYGVHYMYADSNTFIHNLFADNVAGAAIMYSKHIVFRHNAFVRNRGFASYGILFQDCHNVVADSNVISDNVVGMFFEASTGNFFRHNLVAKNDLALQMFSNSTGNTFTANNFIDNLRLLTLVGKRTESKWQYEGIGNYWSSYKGYDLDGNGTGDVPMKIRDVFGYAEGRNASFRLYLNSPSMQALELALESFPVFVLNEELDTAPLIAPVNMVQLPAASLAATPEPESSQAMNLVPPLAAALLCAGVLLRRRSSR